MGLLLKLVLFGVAIYAAWKTVSRWKGLFDQFVGRPQAPQRPAQPPPAPEPIPVRRAPVEDAIQCAGCGAYVPASAQKCGQCGRPLPQGGNAS